MTAFSRRPMLLCILIRIARHGGAAWPRFSFSVQERAAGGGGAFRRGAAPLRLYGLVRLRVAKGKDFAAQIERQIRGARALVALWCSLSVSSRWVREEVHLAHDLGILVPVKIEPCEIPFGFRLADTIDLAGWDGAPRSPALDPLIDALEGRIGRDAAPERKALIEYEATWRRFGARTLKDFALNARLAHAETALPAAANAANMSSRWRREWGQRPVSWSTAEWAKIKDSGDIGRLLRFAEHFARTYYAADARLRRRGACRPPPRPKHGRKAHAEAERARARGGRRS